MRENRRSRDPWPQLFAAKTRPEPAAGRWYIGNAVLASRRHLAKTIILKLIAGVTQPTSGKTAVNGRGAPLIELGAGFHVAKHCIAVRCLDHNLRRR